MTILDFQDKKNRKAKISMITCYDYWSARIISDTPIDCVLVGDSLAMVMHGHPSTLKASVSLMALHISAVSRGAPNKFLIGDMPFMSYRKSLTANMTAVEKIMQAGAHAIKLEGAAGNFDLIRHTVDSGVPVMGHLGLTPQSIHMLGGFKVQAKEKKAAQLLVDQSQKLEDSGCFSIVLECVPSDVAKEVSEKLTIPVIGIGGGPHCDGQVLVLQDMLGMNKDFKPKFLKKYLDGYSLLHEAISTYHNEVVEKKFPTPEESYK
ncbi:MAG: 3-methyl-2-oxobutanoate hydroxymethyltransferase [Pseudobdellovibrionaceae bacterium]